jgi:hypothetical protein
MEDSIKVVRRAIGDREKADENLLVANASIEDFQLRHQNVWNVRVYFNGVMQEAGFTVNEEAGVLVFVTPPADGVEIRVTYSYAALSDAELTDLINNYGEDAAIITALEAILADVSKQRDYKEADSEVKNSQVFEQVRKLLDYHTKKMYENNLAKNGGVSKGRRINDQYKNGKTTPHDLSRLM